MSEPPADPLQDALHLHGAGRLDEALQAYQAILLESPEHPDALHLSGIVLHQQGRHEPALAMMEKAVRLLPQHSGYHYNYGVVLQELLRIPEAEGAYRHAIALDPQNISAWVNLGNLLADDGRLGESANCHRNALQLQPDAAEHHIRLGRSLRLMGDIEGALSHLGSALNREPHNELAHSSLLFTSQYESGIGLAELHRRHLRWAERFPRPAVSGPATGGDRSTDRPLRVGFLSPDLGNHPVGIFLAPLLERLKGSSRVVTVCFNDQKKQDEFRARNRAAAAEWHDIAGLSDDALEALLKESDLDILIELAGHTDSNRLPLLARKPVPIQISWAGYVGTTGLEAIDYLLTDALHSPDGTENFHSETLLRFPCDYIPYEPPPYSPPVSPLPLRERGYPTFGCLNNPTKLTTDTIRLWSDLLNALPRARLLLKYKGMDDPAVQDRIRGLFRVRGITPDRIDMLGGTTHVEHLVVFGQVDVALDPIPYSGGLSTCEAIWMGVPVVTRPGDNFASRHSLSHLTNAGLPDTVARDDEDYLRIAIDLVTHPERLEARRASMREGIRRSPLCDLDGFANDFITAMMTITGRTG